MPWSDAEEFSSKVAVQIKYKRARTEIKQELEDHIRDCMEDFMGEGMDENSAIREAVKSMGNPIEIGKSLNKLHRPYLGWFLKITNILVIALALIVFLKLNQDLVRPFNNYIRFPVDKEIKYSCILKEKDRIDDRTIKLKRIAVYKDGSIYIQYNSYVSPFYPKTPMLGFHVYDDKGKTYEDGIYPSEWKNIYFTKHILEIKNFDRDAKKVILEYDYYNRKMRFEIPLQGGANL